MIIIWFLINLPVFSKEILGMLLLALSLTLWDILLAVSSIAIIIHYSFYFIKKKLIIVFT